MRNKRDSWNGGKQFTGVCGRLDTMALVCECTLERCFATFTQKLEMLFRPHEVTVSFEKHCALNYLDVYCKFLELPSKQYAISRRCFQLDLTRVPAFGMTSNGLTIDQRVRLSFLWQVCKAYNKPYKCRCLYYCSLVSDWYLRSFKTQGALSLKGPSAAFLSLLCLLSLNFRQDCSISRIGLRRQMFL